MHSASLDAIKPISSRLRAQVSRVFVYGNIEAVRSVAKFSPSTRSVPSGVHKHTEVACVLYTWSPLH